MADGRRPRIGLCAALERARWTVWDREAFLLSRAYVDALQIAGAIALMLPPDAWVAEHPDDVLDGLDGLVLAGGGDLDPSLYGSAATARDVDRGRDDAELALARTARDAGLPVLGVCRGAQVLAVLDGGGLVAEVPHVLPETLHRITAAAGSDCASLLGARTEVNSLHHQAIAGVGPGWRVTANADDGIVEAVEWEGTSWPALGVQWHPELDHTGPAVFGWLVSRSLRRQECRCRRAG